MNEQTIRPRAIDIALRQRRATLEQKITRIERTRENVVDHHVAVGEIAIVKRFAAVQRVDELAGELVHHGASDERAVTAHFKDHLCAHRKWSAAVTTYTQHTRHHLLCLWPWCTI